MKAAKKVRVATKKENGFDRLPDAVIIVGIFNKLVNAKQLLRCSSVCKRFASLVYQIDTISIPVLVGHCPYLALKKFTSIRSLRLEKWGPLPSSSNRTTTDGSTSIMWMKSVIGSRLEVSVFIRALGVHNSQHCGGGGGGATTSNSNHDGGISEDECLKSVGIALDSILQHSLIAQDLISIFHLPALCEVVITFKEFGYILHIGKEMIVELRNRVGIPGDDELKLSDVIGGNGVAGVKIWLAPKRLELPSSGLVIDKAMIAVVKPEEGEDIVMERDVGLLLGAFGGGGGGGGSISSRTRLRRRNDGVNALNEFVNVVRKMMVSNQDGASTIKTHRLELV